MNKKGFKTTIVAIIVALLGITTFIMWYLAKVDNNGLTIGLAGLATLGTILIGFFSKDADKSHTMDKSAGNIGGHPNPDKEEK